MTAASWMLPEAAIEWLAHRVQPDWTIVELGSGDGSNALAAMVPQGQLISVEHDERWLGKCERAEYIHAPIVEGWYDRAPLEEGVHLPDRLALKLGARFDCLIIDGPPAAIGRFGAFKNRDLFPPRVPLLIDDVHRSQERELALAFQQERKQTLSIHCTEDGRGFATIGWEVP